MTRRAKTIIAAVVLVLALPRPGAAQGNWFRLQTENFLFIGDAPERQLRDVAQHLEQFRDVMSRALPPAAVVSPVPTIVFVFQAESSFAPYTPRFEGRPVAVAGFFQPSAAVNYLAINAGATQSALRIVFHEYAHFLARNTAGQLPVWANEGLAGVFETFEERSGGKAAVIGIPHPEHLILLQNSTLIPLRDLLIVSNTSPVYNEGDRRGLLYAESWALMHYLMLGNQTRAPQLQDYFRLVKGGEPADEAFLAAFGSDIEALERELREYVRTFSFPTLRIDFAGSVTGSGVGRGDRIDETEARGYLGDLLARMGRIDDARAQLRALVAADGQSARALSALALLEFRADNLDEALPLLERAASLDPDDVEIQRAWGRALFARSQQQAIGDDRAIDTLRQSRTVLNRAVELSPRDAETIAVLARVEVTVGTDLARASTLLERAVALAPSEDRYRLLLADALVRRGDFERAASYAGPLAAGAGRSVIREPARQLLDYIADAVLKAELHPGASGDSVEAPRAAQAAAWPGDAAVARYIPELRRVGPDETRVLGLFSLVECRTGSVVLRIEADSHAFRLEADNLTAVDFISYRDVASSTVGCGPVQPPVRVLATFRDRENAVSANAADGEVVAIELLPDAYAPR